MAAIPFDDLTPDMRKQLGSKKPRETDFSKDDVRS